MSDLPLPDDELDGLLGSLGTPAGGKPVATAAQLLALAAPPILPPVPHPGVPAWVFGASVAASLVAGFGGGVLASILGVWGAGDAPGVPVADRDPAAVLAPVVPMGPAGAGAAMGPGAAMGAGGAAAASGNAVAMVAGLDRGPSPASGAGRADGAGGGRGSDAMSEPALARDSLAEESVAEDSLSSDALARGSSSEEVMGQDSRAWGSPSEAAWGRDSSSEDALAPDTDDGALDAVAELDGPSPAGRHRRRGGPDTSDTSDTRNTRVGRARRIARADGDVETIPAILLPKHTSPWSFVASGGALWSSAPEHPDPGARDTAAQDRFAEAPRAVSGLTATVAARYTVLGGGVVHPAVEAGVGGRAGLWPVVGALAVLPTATVELGFDAGARVHPSIGWSFRAHLPLPGGHTLAGAAEPVPAFATGPSLGLDVGARDGAHLRLRLDVDAVPARLAEDGLRPTGTLTAGVEIPLQRGTN